MTNKLKYFEDFMSKLFDFGDNLVLNKKTKHHKRHPMYRPNAINSNN